MKRARVRDLSATFCEDGALMLRSLSQGRAARVPVHAMAVLAYCSEPRAEFEVAEELGPPGVALYRGLAGAGFLVAPELAASTPVLFGNFAQVDVHRRMLGDRARIDAFAAALSKVVRPGARVLDAGTGSGVLACLAALAGAERVVAVDCSDLLDTARDVVARSGLAGVVKLVRGDFATLDLADQFDVVVTETLGSFALAEGSAADVAPCCTRHLAPGGVVIPRAIELWLAPVGDPALFDATMGPFGVVHGVDLRGLRDLAVSRGVTRAIAPEALAHPGARLLRLPYPEIGQVAGRLRFDDLPAGQWAGLAGWFVLDLTDGVTLPTGPRDPATHWQQVYLPMEPREVSGGESLALEVTVTPAGDDRRALEVATSWELGPAKGRSLHRIR